MGDEVDDAALIAALEQAENAAAAAPPRASEDWPSRAARNKAEAHARLSLKRSAAAVRLPTAPPGTPQRARRGGAQTAEPFHSFFGPAGSAHVSISAGGAGGATTPDPELQTPSSAEERVSSTTQRSRTGSARLEFLSPRVLSFGGDGDVDASMASDSALAAANAEADQEEADAEAQFDGLTERIVDAILDGAVDEVASGVAELQARYQAERLVLRQAKVNFDEHDTPVVSEVCDYLPPPSSAQGRTLLHDVLGSRNVRRLKMVADDHSIGASRRKTREHRVLVHGVMIESRRFHVFAFKEDDVGSFFFVAERGQSWHPFVGLVTWSSLVEARQLFADFESVAQLPKYSMRPALLLSQTVDLRSVLASRLAIDRVVRHAHLSESLPALTAPPPGALQVIELDDVHSSAGSVMTDGGGLISADVADQIGRIRKRGHGQLPSEARESGRGPMVTQMRLWYDGGVAKGTLLRSAALPERTVVLRRSMIKVEARASRAFWAFEIVATSRIAREARTNKHMVVLLESIGGEPMGRALLALAHEHRAQLLKCAQPPLPLHMLSKLAEHDLNDMEQSEAGGEPEPVTSTLGILNAGFEPTKEPYLHQKLGRIVASQLRKVSEGSFPIPQSAFAFGVPDPTGTLEPGTVCLVLDQQVYTDSPALIYRHPGLHPGSVRRVRKVLPTEALRRAFDGVDPERATVIIFSTRGERSLADEMDGGDMDGDEFALIWDEGLVAAFPEASLPAWSEEEQQLLLSSTQKRKPTQSTPAHEEARRNAAAWHMVRTRHGQAAKGRFANQWVLVSEASDAMAKDRRALKLAYGYALALDAAKMGGAGSTAVPEDCQLRTYPRHLATSFPYRNQGRFTASRDTTLARLHVLDATCTLPDCEVPDDWFHLAHASCVPNGQPSAQFRELLNGWEDRYTAYKRDLKDALPGNTDWNDPAKVRILNGVLEKYRELLVGSYSDDEVRCPASDSRLLAEVAAVYAVNHRHYSEGRQRGYDGCSLKFAWHIGGDYLNMIKTRQKAEPRSGSRRGAAPVFDPRTATSLLAVGHQARRGSFPKPASQGQGSGEA